MTIDFAFDQDFQPTFSHLLRQTFSASHGVFAATQEDDNGQLWEYVMTLSSPAMASDLLSEASGGLQGSLLLPTNHNFVIFSGDSTDLWALYNTNDRYYVMRANGRRYYQVQLRGKYHTHGSVVPALRPLYGVSA